MNWTALTGVRSSIPMLVIAVLLAGCGVAQQPGPSPTRMPTPTSCNCLMRIPVRPLDAVPPIVVHPLTKLAANRSTATSSAPAPPYKRHRRHSGP